MSTVSLERMATILLILADEFIWGASQIMHWHTKSVHISFNTSKKHNKHKKYPDGVLKTKQTKNVQCESTQHLTETQATASYKCK